MLLLTSLLTIVLIATAQPPTMHLEKIQEIERHRTGGRFSLDADSSHSYDQTILKLDYRIEDDPDAPLTGVAEIGLVANEDLELIPFNAEGLVVHQVYEDGLPIEYTYENDTIWVHRPIAEGETATISFVIEAPVVESLFDVGFHTGYQHAFTNCEPYGARRWFPCWDQPYDKFDQVQIELNMPDSWLLASNGVLLSTAFPEPGRKTQRYFHESPISSYLVMIAAGNYAKWTESVEDIHYRYMTFRIDSSDAAIDWAVTPDMMDLYEELCGEYPFVNQGQRCYGMVETDIFAGWGAMEHQTMTTMGHQLIDGQRTYEGIVAHELAHQWFGDHLSPVDFRHMWLNEGFATYFAALWFEHLEGRNRLEIELNGMAQSYFTEDANERYAPFDPPEDYLFGNVIYGKSGFILHMLREHLLGDSLFFTTVREYVSEYAGGNVSTDDFIQVVNEVSGENYSWFFDQWIYAAGHPELELDYSWDSDGIRVACAQVQSDAPLYRFPLTLEWFSEIGWLSDTLWFDALATQTQELTVENPSLVRLATFQPMLYEIVSETSVPAESALPRTISFGTAYPNPFNPTVSIPVELSQQSRLELILYNLQGQRVASISDQVFTAGTHTILYSASPELASGVYLLQLSNGDYRDTQKIILLK